jgi:Cu+-exporting ATPase
MDMEKHISIKGITCAGCLNRIDQGLKALGVFKFDYDFVNHDALIFYDDEDTSIDEIIKTINDMGYEANSI